MTIGALEIDLNIPGVHSLKEKRMILQSLKAKIRQEFNVSVAEVDHQDVWQSSVIGVAVVCNDGRFANQVLSKVVDFVGRSSSVMVQDYRLAIL